MSKYRVVVLGIGLILLLAVGIKFFRKADRLGSDVRYLCLWNNKMELVSISSERNMVNRLDFGEGVKIWIPGGLGWYEVDKLSKLLKQEKKTELLPLIAFYNFGFWPDKTKMMEDNSSCASKEQLLSTMSWWEWLKFVLGEDNYLLKEDSVSEIGKEDYGLREELRRDFSETKILNNDLRVGVINLSEESGLANFLADRLDWAGVDVVSVENGDEKVEGGCLIRYGSEEVMEGELGKMMRKLWGCREEKRDDYLKEELEIYLNKDWAEMIKYSSYVRTL